MPGQIAYVSPPTATSSIYQKSLDRAAKAHSIVTGGRIGGARVVPRVRFAHGRVPPGPAAVHRPLRRPRRADRLGPRSDGKCAGRYQFPELVSLLSPHWMPDGQSIVAERPLASAACPTSTACACPAASSSRSPTTATRTSTPARAPTAAGWCSPPTGPPTGVAAPPTCSCSTSDRPASRPAHLGRLGGRVAAVGGRRPDLLHLRPRRRAQRLLGRFRWATGRRETSAWTGAFDAVPLPDGGLVVGGFHDLSWNLYRIPVDSVARSEERFAAGADAAGAAQWGWDDARRHRRRASPPGASPTAGA